MKFTLIIDLDNAAFGDEPTPEIRRILKRLVVGEGGPRYGKYEGKILDDNGNSVGFWSIS